MALTHLDKLGDDYFCVTSGKQESFVLLHLGMTQKPIISVRFSQLEEITGSVHLTREKVEDLATTLLFWLDQTDPNKED